jgi:hypothetical protein
MVCSIHGPPQWFLIFRQVESVYPRRRDVPRAFLDAVVGDTKRQVENKRVEEVVASGSVEVDLRRALEVRVLHAAYDLYVDSHYQERERTDVPVSMPLHDRIFDLVLLSNWEDQIVYEPENIPTPTTSAEKSLTTPINKALESGAWTRSIIWSPRAPFRDFTQLEFNHEDDVVPEERAPGGCY